MKKKFRIMLTTFVLIISMISCNNEDIFTEPIIEVPDTNVTQELVAPEGDILDVTTPCAFELNNVQPNSTLTINCVLDLQGKTITLPPNVTVDYEGGEIINGTLNFSDNSTIDSQILNPSLVIAGSSPLTKDPIFDFNPKRWGIVEGKVSDAVALNNKTIINHVINKVKAFGITTFKIDKMDAYFSLDIDKKDPYFGKNNTNYYGIFVPSNFNLIMTKNTNLRVQPNGYSIYSLLFCWKVENITISGGKLWGDRYTHDYNTIKSTHEWGDLIRFKGVHNAVVDNVEIHEAAGDGFEVYGVSDRNADGTLKPGKWESFNITVKNCLINDNRRNNITIADGTNIFIENNTITNAGSANSTSPGVAVMIESREKKAPDGNSIYEWEKTENVHIRHNVFEDNRADVVLLSGEKTYIYENSFSAGVTIGAASDGKIYNNKFERPEGFMKPSVALTLEGRYWANGKDRVKDYEVNNNKFSGYQYAIIASGQGHEIKNNTINNCQRSITIGSSKDLVFDNNIISSNIDDSFGFYTFSGESNIKNCLIKNGEINVAGTALFFSNLNNDEEGSITIDNVNFNGRIRLGNVQNIIIKNSTFNETKIVNCNPIFINNN